MSGKDALATNVPLPAKLVFILLAGSLSMFCAEVLSGSSVLWFITPWAWLVTFWLYLAHFLLFINLAFRFRRTSLTALYLWGVLFGLYEAWITKVAWAGYAGSEPGWGKILGFAFPELLLIVFFWHPVFSFILPALCFEILSGSDKILPGHRSSLTRSRMNWSLAIIVVLIGAAFLSLNAKGNLAAVVLSIAGSIAIAGILYLVATKYFRQHLSIESLRLGKTGMAILVGYLTLLYVLTFTFLLPERIAPPMTIVLTLGIYAVILLLLWLKKPEEMIAKEVTPVDRLFSLRDIGLLLIVLTIAGIIICIAMPADTILIVLLYIILVIVAPIILALVVWKVWRSRRKAV